MVTVLAVFFTIAALLGLGSASSANNQPAQQPTIVLVHGAWADASGWNGVTEKLQRKGFDVIAPANPLRGLASDAAYLGSVLDTIEGPIVIVGHSYGGAVLTNAAAGRSNVKALVYIAAFAPDTGDTIGGILGLNPGGQVGPETLVFRPHATGVDSYIAQAAFHEAFAGDLSERTTDVMYAAQRPADLQILGEPSVSAAWKTIPSWYMVAARDNTIPPATQRFMASRIGATTVEVRSSHVAMISQPGRVAKLILDAVWATS